MVNWDYTLPENWKPETPGEWEWFLVRKINFNDLAGIRKNDIKKFFPAIKKQLDPGKQILLEYYLYGKK